MRKAELVERVAKATQQSMEDSQQAVDAVFSVIERAFNRRSNMVKIRRFGRFTVKHRKGRSGRNPKTGRPISIPAKWVAVFKPSKELKARVNVPAFPLPCKIGIDSIA